VILSDSRAKVILLVYIYPIYNTQVILFLQMMERKKVEYINQLYFSQANMGKKKARYCLLPKPNLAILSSRHPRQFVPYHRGRLVFL
jgi:hypothetical protein